MEAITQLLTGMADYLVHDVLGLAADSVLGNTLHYFVVGFTEILVLVVLVTYLMGFVTSYLPIDKVRGYLEKHQKSGLGNLIGSGLGAITPFCSCSSIPLFVGMMQARIPLGIALSFLITSPLVNEIAIALFWVSYGWKITVVYVLSGIVLGVLGGILLEKMGMAQQVADWVKELGENKAKASEDKRTLLQRLPEVNTEVLKTLKRLVPYIFIGLALGSFIHGYVPEAFFEATLAKSNFFAVPIAVVLAIPLYIDAVSVLPVIDSLVDKGVPLGTAIAFMMAAIGLSFPEALLLKKVMKRKLIIAFFSTIGLGMIVSGFLFNLIF